MISEVIYNIAELTLNPVRVLNVLELDILYKVKLSFILEEMGLTQ